MSCSSLDGAQLQHSLSVITPHRDRKEASRMEGGSEDEETLVSRGEEKKIKMQCV